jgi:voltage-dependent calcium channel alpha-2/delta-4
MSSFLPPSAAASAVLFAYTVNCGRKSLDKDDYYCNKELVELLVFDAKVTNDSYQSWTFKNDAEREIIERYNATVRFVSSMSGLTRWQFIFGEVEVDYDKEFGDIYSTSLNEPWYKSAVLQHDISAESFVYTVPHHDDEKIEGDSYLKVTASMAIFPRDGGKEAPSAVVGFQFSHQPMYDRFMEITSTVHVS